MASYYTCLLNVHANGSKNFLYSQTFEHKVDIYDSFNHVLTFYAMCIFITQELFLGYVIVYK